VTRSLLEGRTLHEKNYGLGFRPEPLLYKVTTFERCFYEGCDDPVFATAELYVDDPPPGVKPYEQMLRRLPPRTWATAAFCLGHSEEVMQRGLDVLEDPDLWAPGRESPFMFPHPAKLLVQIGQ